ncbi:MAG: hypothetical protein Q8O72_16175 [Bacteroidales bacterium]|jgi:hypothetical protein|nr:hypothetical protein [Bacteroidales bacterium]
MKKLLILLFSFTLIISACKKDPSADPNPNVPASMGDIKVSSNFDWKTTRDIQITLTGKVSAIINVSSSKGVSYQKAFLKANTPYTMKLTIPSYEQSVEVNYMGQAISLELGNGTLSYQFQ